MDRARRPRELIALLVVAACGARAPAPAAPTGPLTAAETIGEGRIVRALATDGGAVWWADADGVSVRAPGAEPRRISTIAASSIAVQGGVVWAGTADGVVRIGADGAVARVAGIAASEPLVVAGGDGVFAAAGPTLYAIDGARASAKATAAGAITAIAVGERAVVWAEWDEHGGGALRRIVGGGAPEQLARLSKAATAIAIAGDQVVWSGDAVALAQWDGHGERVRVAGGGIAIAADRDGVIVHTDAGLVVEHVDHPDGSEAAYVVDQARPGHDLSPAPIAIDARAAYVVEIHPDGIEAIVAVPRPGKGPRLVALTPGPVRRMIGDEGHGLVATWSAGEVTSLARVTMSGAEALTHVAAIESVAAHAGEVWIVDGESGAITARAAAGGWRTVAKPDVPAAGLVVTDSAAYWIDGSSLWRMPNGALPAAVWASPIGGSNQGIQQPLAAFVVLADGTVVLTGAGFTVDDLTAIGPDGTSRVLVPMSDGGAFGGKVVAEGRRVYYVVGGSQVFGIDVDTPRPVRVIGPGNEVVDLAAGGGWLYAAVMVDGVAHIVRSTGQDAKASVDLGAAPGFVPGTLVAQGDGVAWASADAKAILSWPSPPRRP